MICLALMNAIYLLGSVTETVRGQFGGATNLHVLMFPLVIYPVSGFALTASVMMVAAMCIERYLGVTGRTR